MIDPLTPALFKAKFVWRMGVKAPGFSSLTRIKLPCSLIHLSYFVLPALLNYMGQYVIRSYYILKCQWIMFFLFLLNHPSEGTIKDR